MSILTEDPARAAEATTRQAATAADAGPWQHRAACREEDPELFYPVFEHERAELEREALLVCALCPVRTQCLDDELSHGERAQFGTRGGMTESARRELLRRQRRTTSKASTRTATRTAMRPPRATPTTTSLRPATTSESVVWEVDDAAGRALYRGPDAELAHELSMTEPAGHLTATPLPTAATSVTSSAISPAASAAAALVLSRSGVAR